jgi:hypothetical protein
MRYDPAQQTTTIRRHTKFTCDLNTTKEREAYLLRERKLDMEIPPGPLADFGVNEVAVTVEPSVTTEQVANTVSISSMLSVNSGAVSLIVLK